MRHAILCALLVLASAVLFSQAPAKLTFDVVSIKPFAPPQLAGRGAGKGAQVFFGRGGGPGTNDPGRINWAGASLRDVLMNAYDVKRYQVKGPDWLDMERFDITAKVPEGATKEQVAVMWQNLLADRFGVKLHHETKEFQVEEMTVAKGGPKFKETDLDPNTPPFDPSKGPPGPPKSGKDGLPVLPGAGLFNLYTVGPNASPTAHIIGKAQPMSGLATALGNQLNKPVIDKTGLTGKYDFSIEFAPNLNGVPLPPPGAGPGDRGGPAAAGAGDAASEPGSNLAEAVQQQLGLKLTSSKAQLDVIVIDHAEKTPTAD